VFKTAGIFLLILALMGVTMFSSETLSGEVKSLDLQSKEISCASCALTIKNTVSKMPGVMKVDVSAGTKTIHVEYDDSRVTVGQIIHKINSAGFKVEGAPRI
jgi:copper chaperone CopZ